MKNFTTLLFLFASLVSYAQINEQEPNNSFGTANYISKDIVKTGNISQVGDNDYFVAYHPVDGTLKIYIKATNTSATASWLYFAVFGSNKAQLTAKYIAGSTPIASGGIVHDTITLYGRGVDSVFFRFHAGGTFSYDFKYEVIEENDKNDLEPNGSFASAIQINRNENKSGHILYGLNGIVDEFDFYATKTSVDGTLKIFVKATNTSATASWLYFAVFGSNKAQLTAKYIAGSTPIASRGIVHDTITIYGSGVDTVFFRFNAGGTFSYDFKYEIIEAKDNDVEPNGTIASAIPINQNEKKPGHILYGLYGIVDNSDYYVTKTSDDGTLKIYVSATNTSGKLSWLSLTVYGGNRGSLATKYINGPISITPGVTVYDTILVKGIGVDSVFFRFDANGTFTYNVKYEIIEKSNGDKEPNNSFATAVKTSFKQTAFGHLMYKANGISDQVDFYVAPVSTKGELKILVELTNISGKSNNLFLYAYNENKTEVLAKYVKNLSDLPLSQLIIDTIVLKCTALDTLYLRWSAPGLINYRFSLEMADGQPHASMTHERLGNTVGFRPQLANADKFIWDFGDGTTSTQKYPLKTFKPGYYTAQLIATNSQCNFNDTAKTVFEVKGVEYYTPDSSGVGGDAIVKIFGGGLGADTKITLKKGATVLTPIHLESFKNNVQLNAIFDFHLAEEGTYDVSIEIKGQTPVVYPGGFKLTAFRYPYTWSEIVSPSQMRTNLNTNMKLVVGNKGNVMASGALVCVIWPKSVDLTFDTKWFKPPASGNYTITAADTTFNFKWEDIQPLFSDTYNTVTAIDTFNLQPYDGFMMLILIPKIGAGSTVEIPLIAKTTSTGAKDFITFTFKPNLFGSGETGSWMDVSENVAVETIDGIDKLMGANKVLDKSPLKWLVKAVKGTTKHMANLGQVMGATYNYMDGTTNSIYESLEPAKFNANCDAGDVQMYGALADVGLDVVWKKAGDNFMKGHTDDLNKFIATNRHTATAATIEFAIDNLNNADDVRKYIQNSHKLYKAGKDLKTLYSKLKRLEELVKEYPELKPQLDVLRQEINKDMTIRDPKYSKINSVTSLDPNEIIGPIGQGAKQYVLKQERQQFRITFENKDVALAAAQIVNISDTLDATRFDLNTFEFTDFTIANKTYTVPKGRQEFVLQDSLSPVMKVRINGSLEKSTGIVSWQFTAIDPATGDIPVFEGFLPPNKKMPEGEGSVSFTILPKQSLADGTVIRNRASIIFDQNEPIITNTWQNIVDALPPVSVVKAIRVEGSPEIHLTFTGSDASSGISNYDIYIQEEGGEWQAMGNAFDDTETILADSSKRYNFYVLANDNVGNTESKNPRAETTVGINDLLKGKGQFSLWPIPAEDMVFIGGLNQSNTFVISDLSGKKVLSGIISETSNSIDIQNLIGGMYILNIYNNRSFETFKLIKTQDR